MIPLRSSSAMRLSCSLVYKRPLNCLHTRFVAFELAGFTPELIELLLAVEFRFDEVFSFKFRYKYLRKRWYMLKNWLDDWAFSVKFKKEDSFELHIFVCIDLSIDLNSLKLSKFEVELNKLEPEPLFELLWIIKEAFLVKKIQINFKKDPWTPKWKNTNQMLAKVAFPKHDKNIYENFLTHCARCRSSAKWWLYTQIW